MNAALFQPEIKNFSFSSEAALSQKQGAKNKSGPHSEPLYRDIQFKPSEAST
jgi:hypothetical protein